MDDLQSTLTESLSSFTDPNGTSIPIPDASFLTKINKIPATRDGDLGKHERAYDAFCRWAAIPTEDREPKSVGAFENKWKLPKSYSAIFRQRKDFQQKRLTYFWDWMMDRLPDIVNTQFKLAMKTNNTRAAEFFSNLIAKHINIEQPTSQVNQLVLVGVAQEKIDKLFQPKSYEKIEQLIPREDSI